jgi:hypothetical protein
MGMDEDLFDDFDEAVGIHLMNSLNFTEVRWRFVEDKSPHCIQRPTLMRLQI